MAEKLENTGQVRHSVSVLELENQKQQVISHVHAQKGASRSTSIHGSSET